MKRPQPGVIGYNRRERTDNRDTRMTLLLAAAALAYAIFAIVTGLRHLLDKDWAWQQEQNRVRRAGLDPHRFRRDHEWLWWQNLRGVVFVSAGVILLGGVVMLL